MCSFLKNRSFQFFLGSFILSFMMLFQWFELGRNMDYAALPPAPPDKLLIPEDRMGLIGCPDSARWVVYAQKAAAEDQIRIQRWTFEDNYPKGRKMIGWSSPPMWILRFTGWLYRQFDDSVSVGRSILEAARYSNLLIFVSTAPLFFWMGWVCFGRAGFFLYPSVLYFLGHLSAGKHLMFNTDHHLIIHLCHTLTFLALYASVVSGQRKYLYLSAFFCGWGIWTSAPTQALVVISIGLGLLFMPKGSRFLPKGGWYWWSGLSALITLGAYIFEYAPNFPMELVINNPVYAIGLIMAGVYFEEIEHWKESGQDLKALHPRKLLYTTAALLIMGMVILANLQDWYIQANPYMSRWVSLLTESKPLNLERTLNQNVYFFLTLGLGSFVVFKDSNSLPIRVRLLLRLLVASALTFMWVSLDQRRFFPGVLAVAIFIIPLSLSMQHSSLQKMTASLFAVLTISAITSINIERQSLINLGHFPNSVSILQWVSNIRTFSQKIIEVDPNPQSPILAEPTISNFLNFYTKRPVIGTSYFDNMEGLKRDFRLLFAEPTENSDPADFFYDLIKETQIKTIVVLKQTDYAVSYFLFGAEGRIRSPEKTFIYFLLNTPPDQFPIWIQLMHDDKVARVFSCDYTTLSK
jgi:hypothetical protein